jgi:outer membrane protein
MKTCSKRFKTNGSKVIDSKANQSVAIALTPESTTWPTSWLASGLAISLAIGVSLAPTLSMAADAGSWTVRSGITVVAPDDSGDQLKLNGSGDAFIGAVGPEKLGVDSDTQLGITIEYRLTQEWGVELLLSTPFEHTAKGTQTLGGVDIADVKHLPPTLSAIYHFNSGEDFQPYIGAGLNYTLFFSEDTTAEANAAFSSLGLEGAKVELDDSWGVSLQAGADYQINDRWSVNGSVRWIDLNTEADIVFSNGTKISGDVDIDPFVYSLMLGYTF